jgi:hypothetical protein
MKWFVVFKVNCLDRFMKFQMHSRMQHSELRPRPYIAKANESLPEAEAMVKAKETGFLHIHEMCAISQ